MSETHESKTESIKGLKELEQKLGLEVLCRFEPSKDKTEPGDILWISSIGGIPLSFDRYDCDCLTDGSTDSIIDVLDELTKDQEKNKELASGLTDFEKQFMKLSIRTKINPDDLQQIILHFFVLNDKYNGYINQPT